MKRNALLAMATLAVLSISGLVMARGGCGGWGGAAGCGGMQGAMRGVCAPQMGTVQVDKLDNGVKMTVSSTKPEEVKAIQERVASCVANHATMAKASPMKDAAMSAQNTSDGVVITLTSDKPDVVAALQAHAAQCAARREKGGMAQGCGKMGHMAKGAVCPMKGAAVQVTTLANGATVTFTSDDPEAVKAIQARAAQCAARHGGAATTKN
jgi:hypothetical protein